MRLYLNLNKKVVFSSLEAAKNFWQVSLEMSSEKREDDVTSALPGAHYPTVRNHCLVWEDAA